MNTQKRLILIVALLLFITTSSYPFIIFRLHGSFGFVSESAKDIFKWTLFLLWSASVWILGYLYNRLATEDIRMFIISLMTIVAAAILFSDVADHLVGYGNDEEKVIYQNKLNGRRTVIQRFHGAGAVGSDYYDTIYVYQLQKWVRYEELFEKTEFDSVNWIKVVR